MADRAGRNCLILAMPLPAEVVQKIRHSVPDIMRRQMDAELLNLALAITQQFGPERGIPREERLRKAKPGISQSEIDEALRQCDEIEAFAYQLAGKFAGGDIDFEQFRSQLEEQFPLLNEKRIDKTLSQALYFSSR